jgi:ElaB/YqjD/DUF883 family membrane-anchored ribosome-binding protein
VRDRPTLPLTHVNCYAHGRATLVAKTQGADMNDTTSPLPADESSLAGDLRKVIADAEALLQHAVRDAGQEYVKARHRLEGSLLSAKTRLRDAEDAMLAHGREAAQATDQYVRRHPWESIGIGAAVGLAIGLLIGRK